jgi:hypothetical protein
MLLQYISSELKILHWETNWCVLSCL